MKFGYSWRWIDEKDIAGGMLEQLSVAWR